MSLYQEPLRPRVHYTPRRNWMNDPNGPVYIVGEYHLFYQHNPHDVNWGSISWAHVRSIDLLHWEELPLALKPDARTGFPFSGSAVVDEDNRSGLFGPERGVVALFTSVLPGGPGGDDFSDQAQSVAFSRDGGVHWELYEGNPVIDNTGRADFRDPKVFWHAESCRWIMVVAHEDEVLFYRSENLLDWEMTGSFGSDRGSHAGIWECPDLLYLPVENGESGEGTWVLVVGDGDRAPVNKGGTQYFTGHFDGLQFHSDGDGDRIRWVDHGRDFYAAQSWSGIPAEQGRTVWIAWMSQWAYSRDVPTTPWRGVMTLPREVGLRRVGGELRLTQKPVRELKTLRRRPVPPVSSSGAGRDGTQRGRAGEAIRFFPDGEVALELLTDLAGDGEGRVRLTYHGGGSVTIHIDLHAGTVAVDRTSAAGGGFSPHFGVANPATLPAECDGLDLHLIVDASTLELFLLGGTLTMADLILPAGELQEITLEATGDTRFGDSTLYPLEAVRSAVPGRNPRGTSVQSRK